MASRSEQMAFQIKPCCKERGCPRPVVGSSITGEGHVCKRHNVWEWGRALSRNREPYYRKLGAALLGQFEASPSVIEVLMDDGSWRAAVALKPGDGEHDGWVLAQDGSGTNTLVWWCAPGEWRRVDA